MNNKLLSNHKKLKVLFISSGRGGRVGDVVRNQGESLKKAGINLDYFTINSGFWDYFSAIFRLRRTFRNGNYNIAHAHYSYSGIIAGLAGCRPLVVSFMGSDIYMSKFMRLVICYFVNKKWDAVIVKTQEMKESLNIADAHIIPNGVDMERFRPMPKIKARLHVGLPRDKKIILFIAVHDRPEKNIALAYKALKYLNLDIFEFKHLYGIDNSDIPYWLNASDVLLLTSKREGSVNVVKEAMACNCPVVSTDVGDIGWVLGHTNSCFVTSNDALDIGKAIQRVFDLDQRTNGRNRVVMLGLDSQSIAKKIINLYTRIIEQKDTDDNMLL